MSCFDAEIFAQAVMAGCFEVVDGSGWLATSVRQELIATQNDIEATLAALEIERDGRRARALRDDLAQFLPLRKASVLALISPSTQTMTQLEVANLERKIDMAIYAALVAGKAFVTKGAI